MSLSNLVPANPTNMMTKKQSTYLRKLFRDHRDEILLRLFCAHVLKRSVPQDLSDLTKAEASQLIGVLVAIATDCDEPSSAASQEDEPDWFSE